MRSATRLFTGLLAIVGTLTAGADAPPALTVYNQDFGVVRERIHLDLKLGENQIAFNETTAHLEPDSVVLRDPSGKRQLQILEQNYRNDPLSPELLLSLNEGKTIEFLTEDGKIMTGRVIRSAYQPHSQAFDQYGQYYYQRQAAIASASQPIIEVDGKLRFGLPGTPLFPNLGDDTILKPTLTWRLLADQSGPLDAELAYVTGGMSWKADYNIMAPEDGDALHLIGWVTIDNQSGRTFESAAIKLMAGDVKKIESNDMGLNFAAMKRSAGLGGMNEPAVNEKTFDEYHLYSLARPATLRDRETKQIEFARAANIGSRRVYVYDGAYIDQNLYRGWNMTSIRQEPSYGVDCNPKVWVMREIDNKAENGLGIPLPAGRARFYRQDSDERLEFVGENEIDHTPKGETLRVYTGNAFDIVGERRQTRYDINHNEHWVDEAFEIKLRNHKKEAVEIRVVERLYRWHSWEIRKTSMPFEKRDARTIEYRVTVPADGEMTISYEAHYSW